MWQVLSSAEAEAPTAGPSELNLTSIMSKQGCKAFADLILASGARTTFETNIDAGLTVFCPTDNVVKAFQPQYKNLTASQKVSLLLYHAIPVYQSLQMLKTNNGIMNTLATDRANKYDFTVQTEGDDVTLETKVNTAKITGTLIDEEPLVVYKINKFLLPKELFKVPAAKPPKPSKDGGGGDDEADAPTEESDDQTADDANGVAKTMDGGRLVVMVILSLCMGILVM